MRKFFFFMITVFQVLTLCSCCKEKNLDYSDFNDKHILFSEVNFQIANKYFVYFYSTKCGHCLEIKQTMLLIIFKRKDEFYLCVENKDFIYCHSDGVEEGDFCLKGVPTVVLFENQKPTLHLLGGKEIIGYFEDN